MEDQFVFLPLLLVLLLAFIVPPLLSRIRWLPSVVGQIIAGLIIGRSGFKLIQADFTLDFLAEVGLAFLMFLSGLEIDFSLIFPAHTKGFKRFMPFAAGFGSFGLTFGMAAYLSFFLTQRGWAGDPWMLALILSTTSLGVVLPVLKERNLSTGMFGQTVLLAALLADFLTMFFITIYVALRSSGLTLDILLVGVLFVTALFAYRLGIIRMRRKTRGRLVEDFTHPSPQTRVHGAVALLIGFIILSQFLGTEMILGAFLAGAVVSLLTRSGYEVMRHRLEGIGFGFFIPLFFITVGIRFDLPALVRDPQALIFAGIFLVAAFVIKIVPSLLFRFLFSWRETLASGFLLSARLSLIIAAAGIGLRLGAIDETAHAAFILIAAATSTLAPLAFNTTLPSMEGKEGRKICICGVSSLGLRAARDLKNHDEKVVFVESDPEQTKNVEEAGFEVILGGDLWGTLKTLDPESFKAVLILTSDDGRNLKIGREAADLGFSRVIALLNRPSQTEDREVPGVLTFSPSLYQTTLLSVLARNPDLFTLLIAEEEDQISREIYVRNPEIAGRLIRDLGLGGNVLVLSIHRENHVLIPNGNTRLEKGDCLTVLGEREELKELSKRFEWS